MSHVKDIVYHNGHTRNRSCNAGRYWDLLGPAAIAAAFFACPSKCGANVPRCRVFENRPSLQPEGEAGPRCMPNRVGRRAGSRPLQHPERPMAATRTISGQSDPRPSRCEFRFRAQTRKRMRAGPRAPRTQAHPAKHRFLRLPMFSGAARDVGGRSPRRLRFAPDIQ